MLRENPVVKRMFEIGEEQISRITQQLLANEKFVAAMQTVVANTLKAKGMLDKNIRMALSVMNLPTVEDVEGLKSKLDDLEETIRRLEQTVEKLSAGQK